MCYYTALSTVFDWIWALQVFIVIIIIIVWIPSGVQIEFNGLEKALNEGDCGDYNEDDGEG